MVGENQTGPRKTRRWVLIADRVADRVISIGGMLVIGAVLGIMVFLVYEVAPLFKGGVVESRSDYRWESRGTPILGLAIDDHKTIAVSIAKDGALSAWRPPTGVPLKIPSFDFKGKTVTAFSQALDPSKMAFGFSDGTAQLGRIDFRTEIFPEDQIPANLQKIDETLSTDGSAIYSRVPGKQVRKTYVELDLSEETPVSESSSPIVALNYRVADFGERPKEVLVATDDKGGASLNIVESKVNLFTRKTTKHVSKVPLPPLPPDAAVKYALATDMGDEVYFVESSGRAYRYNTRDPDRPTRAETTNLLPPGVELTALGFLLGDRSLVVGGSDGSVGIYFSLEKKDATSTDGYSLVRTREFPPHRYAVTGFSANQRGKSFATTDASGEIWLRHGTSQKTLLNLDANDNVPKQTLILAPRLNGLLALGQDGRASFWDFSVPHPETSLRTLFGKVWYEGYPGPTYTWQSTGATDAFEPKVSLVPLIFGTIKATFYSLLFAIPVALLAAIYTSEFLPGTVRSTVKPLMEVMASLPSVILGFVAALVLAPIVETWVAAILLAFVALPVSLIFAAFLWQLLPPRFALRLQGAVKHVLMIGVVGASLYVSYLSGPMFEGFFFGGNFMKWLNGGMGPAAPFTALLLLPVVAMIVSMKAASLFGGKLDEYISGLPMPYSALLDLIRWLGVAAITVALSYVVAVCLEYVGLDPRGSVVGTYVQRNTLIVGFAMGFAVIPIIYTLAEDALNSVPDHLRSASLACGATPWQTARWIVLPTAISGVFSAIMIGMGRAVGETMIVVMAAGNTPIMDWNIFEGLRALSANIAVEMPEAPKDGTLYRTLFLTALVLFSMTFVINTVAELVRLRFRKRTMQL
jgi:phosphate transport system permease protein